MFVPGGRRNPMMREDDPKTKLELNNRLSGKGSVLQLNIKMSELHHEVWRRILVPKDSTFYELHWCIQSIFEWQSYHMFEFKKGRQTIEDPEMKNQLYVDCGTKMMKEMMFPTGDYRDPPKPLNAKKTKLSRYLSKVGDEITYEYDFGDNWIHLIKVEEILDPEEGLKYPVCTGGERKGPPEDAGSRFGYEDMCKALGKPKTARTRAERDKIKWLKESYPTWGTGEDWKPADCKFEIGGYVNAPCVIPCPQQ